MYDYTLQYDVPVIMIMGDNDWTTPYHFAFQYFNDISAPYKEFITIERVGHIPFVDKQKDFSGALLQALKRTCSYD